MYAWRTRCIRDLRLGLLSLLPCRADAVLTTRAATGVIRISHEVPSNIGSLGHRNIVMDAQHAAGKRSS